MATRRSEAEALRIAYGAGLVVKSEVIAWADAVVASEEHPEPLICEIATASHVDPSELHLLLDAVPGAPDPTEVAELLLRSLRVRWQSGAMSVSEVARALYALGQHDRCAFSANDQMKMLTFDDELGLAETGIYGDVARVTAEIDAFLSRRPPDA